MSVATLALVAVITFGVAAYIASGRVVLGLLSVCGSAIFFGGLVGVAAVVRRAYPPDRTQGLNPALAGTFLFALAAQVNMFVFEGPDVLSFGLVTVALVLLAVGLFVKTRSRADDNSEP